MFLKHYKLLFNPRVRCLIYNQTTINHNIKIVNLALVPKYMTKSVIPVALTIIMAITTTIGEFLIRRIQFIKDDN